jgi:hypothetical protein
MASPTLDKTSGKPRRKRRWLQFGLPVPASNTSTSIR